MMPNKSLIGHQIKKHLHFMRKLRLFQNICLKTSHTKQYQYKKAGSKRNDKNPLHYRSPA
ncbi:hypothetical protein B14_00900 [Bacillus licheniformis]|nr:hypothetical protein MUY_003705 [Bacillus licheniformis WX-02]ARC60397.1 hypothetical protein BaDB11_01755 [Bacillus licheniformis]PZW79952.1 hypothetical protein DEU48_107247 [Bacillus sp. AG442]ARC63925.1 hypothetical protein B14_00900 [Bacillus licheniformis]ARC69615.1 hypothetical protein B34_02199 [Bacillus licheniformis]